MKRPFVVIAIFALAAGLPLATRLVWLEGFDTGAATMQCVDAVAIEKDAAWDQGHPCHDAHERWQRPLTRLFRRTRS